MKNLNNYLARIGLSSSQELHLAGDGGTGRYNTDRATLARVMEGQSRCIPFENFDVVLQKKISIAAPDVEQKLVDGLRGGYCWELNTLLKLALEDMGYSVTPLMCRVRWGKPDDTAEPNTAHTHFALKVQTTDGSQFLADVGFAGTNSMAPIDLGVGSEPQELPEGLYRVVPSKHQGCHVLELQVKNEWRPLYEWRNERAHSVDQICSNWFSCTFPMARFTTQLFACRIIGNERHHILNASYVIRRGHGVEKEVTTETIVDKGRLLDLIDAVFGVKLVETDGIDRFLG